MNGMPGEASRISLYIRIASNLRTRIESAEWRPGEQIPTIDRLAAEYRVSRITVRQALALLAQDKLVTSTRGRGTFVEAREEDAQADGFRTSINSRLELADGQTVEILSRETIETIPQKFQPVEKIFDDYMHIRKLHLHQGEPFALIDSVTASHIYEQLPRRADEKTKLLRLILDHAKTPITHSRQEITITYADHATSELLRCSLMAPLVKIRSWRRDAQARLIFGTVTLYRADRFLYDIVEHDIALQDSSALVIPKPTRNGNGQDLPSEGRRK